MIYKLDMPCYVWGCSNILFNILEHSQTDHYYFKHD
jgi:hypothetical protein